MGESAVSASIERLRTDVHQLLQRYEPAGNETIHLEAMVALAKIPGDVVASDHYVPGHFTASGFVVDETFDRLLLIHHGKLDRWLQPGGHVELSDINITAAALREVFEETGVVPDRIEGTGIFDLDVHGIPERGGIPGHEHHDVRFLFVAKTTELVATDEVRDARWVALEDVAALGVDESVLRPIRKITQLRR